MNKYLKQLVSCRFHASHVGLTTGHSQHTAKTNKEVAGVMASYFNTTTVHNVLVSHHQVN